MVSVIYIAYDSRSESQQLKIVQKDEDVPSVTAGMDYWSVPQSWRDVGRVNRKGRVIWLDTKYAFSELLAAEPLTAGMVFRFET